MNNALHRLPYDILFYITLSLNFDDIINLGRTCQQLKGILYESTLCRRTIEANFPYAKEAYLARSKAFDYSYDDALQNICKRREAFSNAYPFAARIFGRGHAFIYRQGVLCILRDKIIHVSDVHSSSSTFELDLSSIISSPDSSSEFPCEPKISMLYYSDDIISVHCEIKGQPETGVIFALSTKYNPPKIIKRIALRSSYKIFARHTSQYLYYGTYTANGNHGHREWAISGVSLGRDVPDPNMSPCLQLDEFFGTDIGSTIAFEIHKEHFYAVSNQTSFEVEELDWTSFYHCVRFPLQNPTQGSCEVNKRAYRRQHSEGPIHDSWTDLTLQFDEETDEAKIVEARREWHRGSSRQSRTFYISRFESTDPETVLSNERSSSDGPPLLPADDAFTPLVGSTDNPNWAPVKLRRPWMVHPEFVSASPSARSFILARTKFRGYNYSCTSFLDLVEDDRCCASSSSGGACLRIRVGARRLVPDDSSQKSVDSLEGKASASPQLMEQDGTKGKHSPIKMWPPPANTCPCSKKLHRILNPPSAEGPALSKSVSGVLDERSLVYMVRGGRTHGPDSDNNALGTIVLIDFNPAPLPVSKHETHANTTSLGHENTVGGGNDDQTWQWHPGLPSLCRSGACR